MKPAGFVVRSARGKGTTIRVLLPPVPTSLLEARPFGTAPGVELPWMLEVKTPAPFPLRRISRAPMRTCDANLRAK